MAKKTLLTTCLSFYMPQWRTATNMQTPNPDNDKELILDWEKVAELANYLQTEHYLTMHLLTVEDYKKLKRAEKELCIKLNNVAGGLWCLYATWHSEASAIAQIPGQPVDHETAEAWRKYDEERLEYDKRRVTAAGLLNLQKTNIREFNRLMKRWGFMKGRKPSVEVMNVWVGKPPVEPEKKAKRAGQRSARNLTLIFNNTITRAVKTKITKGKNAGKFTYTDVTTKTEVKRVVVPLDPELTDAEINGAVAAYAARLGHDPLVPAFTDYEFTIE